MKNIFLKLERVSSKIMILLAFVLPLFVIPSQSISLDISKIFFASILVLIALLTHILYSFSKRNVAVPSGILPKAIVGVVLASVIATIVSPVVWKSFMGNGFEIGTTLTLLMWSLIALSITTFIRKTSDQVYVLGGFIIGTVISVVYPLARFILGPEFISFGYFGQIIQTPLGLTSEASVVVAIAAVLVAYIFTVSKNTVPRILLSIFEAILIVFLIATNVFAAWIILATGAILILATRFVRAHEEPNIIVRTVKTIAPTTVIILAVALIGIGAPRFMSSLIASRVNLVENTIKPSWQASVDILSESIKLRPFTGIGPNRFSTLYVATRPASINMSEGWNLDFEYGVSYLFTLVTTHGLLMLIALIILGVYAAKIFVQNIRNKNDGIKQHVQTTVTIGAFLGCLSLIFINPNATLLGFISILFGLVISLQEGSVREITLERVENKLHYLNVGFLGIFGIFFLVLLAINIQNMRAYLKLGSALRDAEIGQFDSALIKARKAYDINRFADIYPRFNAEISAVALQQLVREVQAQSKSGALDDTTVEKFKILLDKGSAFAQDAIAKDPTNYLNALAEIHIAEAGLLVGAQNAYEVVNAGYDRALALNPSSATLYLNRAMTELSQKNFTQAETYATNALYLKPDYIDAIMILAQNSIAQNKNSEAINLVERAVQAMPQNPRMVFELGALKYSLKNYSGALAAFEKTETLVPGNQTVQYYIGVTLAQLGRRTDAIAKLSPLSDSNPQNAELAQIVSNLRTGKNPFGGVDVSTVNTTNIDSEQDTR